jgi:uncharacterized protein (DUF302 family)
MKKSAVFAALLALLAVGQPAAIFAQTHVKPVGAATPANGIVRIRSAYTFDETVARLKADIASKGITFFLEVDQTRLASDAGIKLRPSKLLIFGNPGLGSHFVTANPDAGIDWPVRLLVSQADDGSVHAVYTDFAYIARRHQIHDRRDEFAMASKVITSITSAVAAR